MSEEDISIGDRGITRRSFLAIGPALAAGLVLRQDVLDSNEGHRPNPERGKFLCNDPIFLGKSVARYEQRFYTPTIKEVPTWIKEVNPGYLPDWENKDEVVELRRERDISLRIMRAIKLLGVVQNRAELNYQTIADLPDKNPLKIDLEDILAFQQTVPSDSPEAGKAQNLISMNIRGVNILYGEENPRFNVVNTCSVYATDVCALIGIGEHISHRINPQTKQPVQRGGQELNADMQREWVIQYGPTHGWFDVTSFDYPRKTALLRSGHIFFGAWRTEGNRSAHNWLIFGAKSGKDLVIPALTQATRHVGIEFAHPDSHDDNTSYKINNNPSGGKILYAFKVT